MAETYGELLAELVDEIAKYEDRADVFRRNEIPRGHYYNVINPNRKTSGDNPFYCPTEWGVRLTNDSKNYKWLRGIVRDCKCILVTPEEFSELKDANPEKAIRLFSKIIGLAKKA